MVYMVPQLMGEHGFDLIRGELVNHGVPQDDPARAADARQGCVGFGISTSQQAGVVAQTADGVIVGSACVKTVGESEAPVETARQFARTFQEAVKRTLST